jgi:hypothetical protein
VKQTVALSTSPSPSSRAAIGLQRLHIAALVAHQGSSGAAPAWQLVDLGSIDEDTRNAARHQAQRVVQVAGVLKRSVAAA